MVQINSKEGAEFSLNHRRPSEQKGAADWMSRQMCCSKYEAVWLRARLPLTHSRFMSAYRWRRALHLACSGCKSCACVTTPRPRMWADFLLWHLIWLTWHQQAAVDSHNCHLVTEQGEQKKKKKKRRKRLSGGRRGEKNVRKGRGGWGGFTQSWKRLGEKYQNQETKTHKRERIFSFFLWFERTDHSIPFS